MSTAEKDQYGRAEYTRDDWEKTEIPSGTKLYRLDYMDENGDVHPSNYFIDDEQMKNGDYVSYKTGKDGKDEIHFDAEKYADDLQIKPYIDSKTGEASYPNHVSVYEVPEGETIQAEKGKTDANYAYGHGGAEQYYVPNEEMEKLDAVKEEYIVDNREVDYVAAKDQMIKGVEVSHTRKKFETAPDDEDDLYDCDLPQFFEKEEMKDKDHADKNPVEKFDR